MSETVTPRPDDVPEPEVPLAEPAGEATSWVRRLLIAAAVIFIGMRVSLSTLGVIAALLFFIFMHELGHYLTARWAGMKVTEFFLGFGPRIWSFKRGETEYGIKPIPLGAYVRIIGMTNLEEVDPAEEARTYRQKPYWRRLSVAVAGSTMHFLMAIALAFAVVSVVGTPDRTSADWTVGVISTFESGPSPAEEAGLELGDRIVAVDGRSFETFDDLALHLRDRPGQTVELEVVRNGEELTLTTTLAERNTEGEPVGFLGVGPQHPNTRMDPFSGAVEAVKTTGSTMVQSVTALGQFFSPSGIGGYVDTLTADAPAAGPGEVTEGAENRLLSPVGAVQVANQAAGAGLREFLSFLFLINVFIGVFNLLPMLPFDGGHVVIATYERIRSRKGQRYFADVSKLMPVTYAVIVVLLTVAVSALYLDISNPIQLNL